MIAPNTYLVCPIPIIFLTSNSASEVTRVELLCLELKEAERTVQDLNGWLNMTGIQNEHALGLDRYKGREGDLVAWSASSKWVDQFRWSTSSGYPAGGSILPPLTSPFLSDVLESRSEPQRKLRTPCAGIWLLELQAPLRQVQKLAFPPLLYSRRDHPVDSVYSFSGLCFLIVSRFYSVLDASITWSSKYLLQSIEYK